jgi:hypothetical protein
LQWLRASASGLLYFWFYPDSSQNSYKNGYSVGEADSFGAAAAAGNTSTSIKPDPSSKILPAPPYASERLMLGCVAMQTRLIGSLRRFLIGATLIGAACVAGVAPAWCQTTWKGLTFGSSVAQVQQDLKKAGVADLRAQDKPLSIQGPVSVQEIKLDAELLFNKTGEGLSQVGLFFEDNAQGSCDIGSRGGHQLFVFRTMSEALVQKYGSPSTSSRWPSEDQISYKMAAKGPDITAERIWKVDGQSIKLKVDFVCGSMFLKIIYQPISDEL